MQTVRNYICAVYACQKNINSDLNLVTHKRAHQPNHFIFSVHANTTFRFINQNEFSPIEPRIVHVNVAPVSRCNYIEIMSLSKTSSLTVRHVKKDERKYYEELLKYSREHLMLYPYHLSDIMVKGLRVTPFSYYISIMEVRTDQLLNNNYCNRFYCFFSDFNCKESVMRRIGSLLIKFSQTVLFCLHLLLIL